MSGALLHGVLALVPALALALVLGLGRYPGEAAVSRLARRSSRVGGRASAQLAALADAVVRRPKDPLACSLAGRAPPRRTALQESVHQT